MAILGFDLPTLISIALFGLGLILVLGDRWRGSSDGSRAGDARESARPVGRVRRVHP
jgi:hypothetical protein